MSARAFEPDEEYDRAYASDGFSRYGAYLASYAHWFVDHDMPTTSVEGFAAMAWRVAQSPVMSPPYVRHPGRVQITFVSWDDDGRAAVRVDLAVSSAPEALCLALPWRRWKRDEHGHWLEPDDHTSPNAITVLQVALPLADIPLPEPRYQLSKPDTAVAKQAVRAICGALNGALAQVLSYDPLAGVA